MTIYIQTAEITLGPEAANKALNNRHQSLSLCYV
jgi:hypothetical protein